MPITFPRGFEVTTDEAIDIRLVLTKEQMANAEELFMMPMQYFCLCAEDNQIYIYDINNEIVSDPESCNYGFGKFRPVQVKLVAGDGISIKDKDTLKIDITDMCLTVCNPMDCSPPGSSVHGILQARILDRVAIPFSGGSSCPRD